MCGVAIVYHMRVRAAPPTPPQVNAPGETVAMGLLGGMPPGTSASHAQLALPQQVAMEALTEAKQAVRQQQADAAGGDAAMPGQIVRIKELDDVISGRVAAQPTAAAPVDRPACAMAVIDTSSRAPLFFRCASRLLS